MYVYGCMYMYVCMSGSAFRHALRYRAESWQLDKKYLEEILYYQTLHLYYLEEILYYRTLHLFPSFPNKNL